MTSSSIPTKITPPSESLPVKLIISILGATVIISLLIIAALLLGYSLPRRSKYQRKVETVNTKSDHIYSELEDFTRPDLLNNLSPPDLPDRKPPVSIPKSTSTVPPKDHYYCPALNNPLKKELLKDPFITDESREKIREELAKPASTLGIEEYYSTYLTLTDVKMKYLLEDPFITDESRNKIREELAKPASRLGFEAYYSTYSTLTDDAKKHLLEDRFVTSECKNKIREELEKPEPRLGFEEYYSKYSTLTDAENKQLLEDPLITDECKEKNQGRIRTRCH